MPRPGVLARRRPPAGGRLRSTRSASRVSPTTWLRAPDRSASSIPDRIRRPPPWETTSATGSAASPEPISLRAPRDRGFWIATAALVAALAGFGWAGHLALGLRTTEHRIGALAAEVRVLQEDDHDRAVARLRAQMQNGWIVAEASGARPGVAVPDELWIRWDDQATFWKVPMDDRGWIEAYDAPAGELVGYLLPDSTFVPLEEADGSAVPVTGS